MESNAEENTENINPAGSPEVQESPPVEESTPVEAAAPAKAEDSTEAIKDDFAYWKSQTEKYQRLLRKSEKDAAETKGTLQAWQESQQKEIEGKLAELSQRLEQQTEAAEAAKLEANKVSALAGAGLGTEMLEFITGSDPEAIARQVNTLATKLAKRSPLGNSGFGEAEDLSWYRYGSAGRKSTFGE